MQGKCEGCVPVDTSACTVVCGALFVQPVFLIREIKGLWILQHIVLQLGLRSSATHQHLHWVCYLVSTNCVFFLTFELETDVKSFAVKSD